METTNSNFSGMTLFIVFGLPFLLGQLRFQTAFILTVCMNFILMCVCVV